MKKTVCWAVVGLMISSAFAAEKKQHTHRDRRDSVTYREGGRIRHSDYDPTKLPASNQASDKDLKQIEKQANRTQIVRGHKTATTKLSMASPQGKARAERNVPMNFQYKGPKVAGTTTQSRGKQTGRRMH